MVRYRDKTIIKAGGITMIINGYFKLARDGSVFKGALDISDKGEVVSMYGKLMKHRPDASFKELRTAYTAGEVYVSSKDMLLLDNKAVVTKGVRI